MKVILIALFFFESSPPTPFQADFATLEACMAAGHVLQQLNAPHKVKFACVPRGAERL